MSSSTQSRGALNNSAMGCATEERRGGSLRGIQYTEERRGGSLRGIQYTEERRGGGVCGASSTQRRDGGGVCGASSTHTSVYTSLRVVIHDGITIL